MNFENSTDVVCITSDEGDALVPGTEARAVAEQEANATGRPVTIRDPVTDKVLATIRPASVERPAPMRPTATVAAFLRSSVVMSQISPGGDPLMTALPMASGGGRFSPLGPRGIGFSEIWKRWWPDGMFKVVVGPTK